MKTNAPPPRKNKEAKMQSNAFIRFWNTYPEERMLLHANNNNSGNAKTGMDNRSLGVVAGVSDMEYNKRGRTYFIEWKTLLGVQSPAQKQFQAKVESEGFLYFIVRSEEEGWALLEQIRKGWL